MITMHRLFRRSGAPLLVGALVVCIAACRHEKSDLGGAYRGAPVILISIDTLRADHLPAFGYKNVDTPNIDALRKDGILYTRAYSHVPLTLPSHVSVLTGLLPPSNKVRNNIGYRLDPSVPTLPKSLHGDGYATGAAVSAYFFRGSPGVSEGFHFFCRAHV